MGENIDWLSDNPRFNGSDYDPKFDNERLTGQIKRVYNLMIDGKWRTLSEMEQALVKDPQASISAQLRHLRKKRFGSHIVNKRPRGDRANGLFEYQLLKAEVEMAECFDCQLEQPISNIHCINCKTVLA
jgi:hypothetical protein